MRWMLALAMAAAAWAGCVDDEAPADELAPEAAGDGPMRVFDGQVFAAGVGGAAGTATFEVPEGAYMTLTATQVNNEEFEWAGEVRAWLEAPDGETYTLFDNTGAGAAGMVYVGGCVGCSVEAPYEPGPWDLRYETSGYLQFDFVVDLA